MFGCRLPAIAGLSLTLAASLAATDASAQATGTTSLSDTRPGIDSLGSDSSARSALPRTTRSRLPLADKSAFKMKPSSPDGDPGISSATGDLSAPQAFGGAKAPYTTARVAVAKLGQSDTKARTPVTSYPFRATGKIYARFGEDWFICTASLVKKGVLITAAHCIFEYGKKKNGWADEVLWIPANEDGNGGIYGTWKWQDAYVPNPYFEGTDTCSQIGVVCNNDLATIVLKAKQGRYVGEIVGWYNYAWNGYSYKRFKPFKNTVVHITQLGYPGAFDDGYQMIRTDAVGWYVKSGKLKNTQMGSAQTGGSSGGPWLVNLGAKPKIDTTAASLGKKTDQAVIGVTSYGSTTLGYNRQGASYFGKNKEYPKSNYGGYGAGNIGKLMQDTCKAHPSHC